jgi:hypothetical protein
MRGEGRGRNGVVAEGGEGAGVGERGGVRGEVRGGGDGRCHALGGGMVSRGCRADVAEGGGRGKARGALGNRDKGGEGGPFHQDEKVTSAYVSIRQHTSFSIRQGALSSFGGGMKKEGKDGKRSRKEGVCAC